MKIQAPNHTKQEATCQHLVDFLCMTQDGRYALIDKTMLYPRMVESAQVVEVDQEIYYYGVS